MFPICSIPGVVTKHGTSQNDSGQTVGHNISVASMGGTFRVAVPNQEAHQLYPLDHQGIFKVKLSVKWKGMVLDLVDVKPLKPSDDPAPIGDFAGTVDKHHIKEYKDDKGRVTSSTYAACIAAFGGRLMIYTDTREELETQFPLGKSGKFKVKPYMDSVAGELRLDLVDFEEAKKAAASS